MTRKQQQQKVAPVGTVRAAMGYEDEPGAEKPAERDTSVKKVASAHSPMGAMGQTYLVSGKRVSMRLWDETASESDAGDHTRPYETVGYVLSGRADLHLEGQKVELKPGDSWLVPAGTRHRYEIRDAFRAVEATAPPAEVHGRDE